jgi:two-component system, OmpR family, phosphate regulon sensor histidine kinase PhoR
MSDLAEAGRAPITRRFLVVGMFTALVLILLLTGIVDRSIRSIWLADLDSDLLTVAQVASVAVPADGLQEWAFSTAEAGAVRVTIIDVSGLVLADSDRDPATMENHRSRPEVTAALAGRPGYDTRVSVSTGIGERYVALPPVGGLIVRVSTQVSVIEAELEQTRAAIVRVALAVAVLALAVLVYAARRLAGPVGALAEQAQAIAEGRLDVTARRSSVAELDRLGLSLEAIARDLGGRVTEAEEASSLLEVVLETIPQGTILFDPSDNVAYSNPSGVEILGAVPRNLAGLVPFQLQGAVKEARESMQTVVREVDHGVPRKRIRAIATPFPRDLRVLLVVVDVTERDRIDSMRRDFVTNASHELKTPVATILASTEALQIAMSRDDANAAVFASRIDASARQLQRLVADLLDLARLEREVPDLFPVRLDIVAGGEIERIRPRVADNGLTLDAEVEPILVEANPNDVALAIRNLLDNAIRHTSSGGIRVRVGPGGGQAMIRITDTGEGIPSKDLDRVFERFYRVDSARSRGSGGTGLGLAIVKHVAETHGGAVSVESRLGSGSTFTLLLPASAGTDPGDN